MYCHYSWLLLYLFFSSYYLLEPLCTKIPRALYVKTYFALNFLIVMKYKGFRRENTKAFVKWIYCYVVSISDWKGISSFSVSQIITFKWSNAKVKNVGLSITKLFHNGLSRSNPTRNYTTFGWQTLFICHFIKSFHSSDQFLLQQ